MKQLSIFLVAIMALLACSCSSNTPSGVAEKALNALSKKDYKTVASLMCNKNGEAFTPEQQEQFATLLQQKATKLPENFTITDETVSEDGNTATVKYDATTNGRVKHETLKFIKCPDGKWRIDAGK